MGSILISNTILYCLTDNTSTPQVVWSYEDVFGNNIVLSGTTDASTGISTLSITTNVPGYYSCEVSLEGGMSMTYTVEMMDVSQYVCKFSQICYKYNLNLDSPISNT